MLSKKLLLSSVVLLVLVNFIFVGSVGASSEMWSRTYGGTEEDVVSSMVATSDGGYIMTGYTESFGASEKDVWLVKTDGEGNMVWNRTYGGPNSDYGESVQQTSDGGYIVAGYTGWLEELPYDKSDPFYIIPANRPHEFHFDAYVVKTDAEGNLLWNRTYSSEGDDYGHSVEQTVDGGYVITGYTRAFGIGGGDSDDFGVWLFKIDGEGDVEWSRTYGGGVGYSVQQTSDGGYIIGGNTNDFLLIKTDPDGYMTWNKTYDRGREDTVFSVIQTSNEGYLVAGTTRSFPERVHDSWVVKTDPDGDMEWNRTYGGSERDSFRSVQQTVDGGYIMAGHTSSFGLGFLGGAWLVKTDGDGNMLWNCTYINGEDDGGAASIVETLGGGYVVAGSTASIGAGISDFWLFKVDYSAPQITVLSPVNGSYPVGDVALNFAVSEPAAWTGYSLDGQENVTIAGNTTISGLSIESHQLTVYANDTTGNMGASETISFTITEENETEPLPATTWTTPLIIMAAVVAAIVAFALYFTKTRKPTQKD